MKSLYSQPLGYRKVKGFTAPEVGSTDQLIYNPSFGEVLEPFTPVHSWGWGQLTVFLIAGAGGVWDHVMVQGGPDPQSHNHAPCMAGNTIAGITHQIPSNLKLNICWEPRKQKLTCLMPFTTMAELESEDACIRPHVQSIKQLCLTTLEPFYSWHMFILWLQKQ